VNEVKYKWFNQTLTEVNEQNRSTSKNCFADGRD